MVGIVSFLVFDLGYIISDQSWGVVGERWVEMLSKEDRYILWKVRTAFCTPNLQIFFLLSKLLTEHVSFLRLQTFCKNSCFMTTVHILLWYIMIRIASIPLTCFIGRHQQFCGFIVIRLGIRLLSWMGNYNPKCSSRCEEFKSVNISLKFELKFNPVSNDCALHFSRKWF